MQLVCENNLLQYAIQLVCVKWNKRDSFQKNPIYYSMLFNKRGSFQKTTIYYCNNLCAYWNETRGTVFKKKQQFITVCYSTCVHIEMKQEDSFQKNPINDNMLLNLCAKWNKRGSFQKTTIYYSMLFNLCAYWNETRGTVFKKKKKQFITVCYSTCVHIEMKQDGQFSKKSINDNMLIVCEMKQEGQFSKNNNLLQYAIQLVCVLKWNKRDSFQKKINDNLLLVCEMKQEGQFSKNNNLLHMLFNLCPYWNETRGTVFKKKPIYYSMLFNKRGSFQKTTIWNENETRGTVFKKKQQIYYSMLFNLCAYWNETRWTVFKKIQLMTICY